MSACAGGLDFTKTTKILTLSRSCAGAIAVRRRCNPQQAETGEIKGHYLNVTAPTCER